MHVIRIFVALVALALLGACQTTGAGGADYERHKANRDAYLYQGL